MDLERSLAASGIGIRSISHESDGVRVSGRIADTAAFSQRAGSLGSGKVKADGSRLSFQYQGKPVTLELTI